MCGHVLNDNIVIYMFITKIRFLNEISYPQALKTEASMLQFFSDMVIVLNKSALGTLSTCSCKQRLVFGNKHGEKRE